MSLYNFMFTESSSMNQPWFIDSNTGRIMTGIAVKARTDSLAHGLKILLQSGGAVRTTAQDPRIYDVVGIVSPNSLEFAPAVWASHKLGCTVACMGGGSTMQELKYQFSLTGTRIVFCHVNALERVTRAAKECNIPLTRIVVIMKPRWGFRRENQAMGILTADSLIRWEAKTWVTWFQLFDAFRGIVLQRNNWTTEVILPHSAVIAEINQLKQSSVPTSRVAEGDKALGVIPSHTASVS
ncbi:hypothetical protein C8F04DRAFT_1324957 [Mycena alexandri]|uniref:AMP-dependent synthetase/ligase domain-containing protein n=1 Tax=Mycena alexandri TaxID=1745969 RepID=A0AAD6S1H8_9AGAR|nr:hypothetical protein C8F04DRAFT_1324957 [Mycena alexandri]